MRPFFPCLFSGGVELVYGSPLFTGTASQAQFLAGPQAQFVTGPASQAQFITGPTLQAQFIPGPQGHFVAGPASQAQQLKTSVQVNPTNVLLLYSLL